MMNSELSRRGFLTSCLALCAAPAIVRAENLMKLWVPPQRLILPESWTSIMPSPPVAVFYKLAESGDLLLMMKQTLTPHTDAPEGWSLYATAIGDEEIVESLSGEPRSRHDARTL